MDVTVPPEIPEDIKQSSVPNASTNNLSTIKSRQFVWILIAIILILVIGSGGMYLALRKNQPTTNKSQPNQQMQSVITPQPQGKLFSGHVQKLAQNLGLMVTNISTDSAKPQQGVDTSFVYYTAGPR